MTGPDSPFARALASRPAPRTLGDVTLRYEPSMLVGETRRGAGTWRPKALWWAGMVLLGLSAVAVLVDEDAWSTLPLALGATSVLAAAWLARREKRQRRFVANFGTVSLRLDFNSPIAGQPSTIVVTFDDVKDVTTWTQEDDAECLLVDFQLEGRLLREVLVAHVTEAQHEDLERFARFLRGAFGLAPPADVQDFRAGLDTSSFEPAPPRPTGGEGD